jgi:hypothetical protein
MTWKTEKHGKKKSASFQPVSLDFLLPEHEEKITGCGEHM